MAVAIPTSFAPQLNTSGALLASGSVKVCAAGTTDLLDVFSNSGLSVSAINPVNLDSAAEHDMRYIAPAAYKLIWYSGQDGGGTQVRVRDNIDPGVPIGSGILAIDSGGTGADTAEGAVASIGAATSEEVADLAADVAALAGAAASTEKTHLATGTTAQRDTTPDEGDVRRNTTIPQWEGYNGADWESLLADASTAEILAETAVPKGIRPDRLKNSQRVAKAWGKITWSAGTPTLQDSHGVTSINDDTTGKVTVTLAATMGNSNYGIVVTPLQADFARRHSCITTQSTTQFQIVTVDSGANLTDPDGMYFVVFGDLA